MNYQEIEQKLVNNGVNLKNLIVEDGKVQISADSTSSYKISQVMSSFCYLLCGIEHCTNESVYEFITI